MNARSLFVIPFVTAASLALVAGALALRSGAVLQGSGALLAGGAVLVFFTVLMSQRVARFHDRLPWPMGAAAAGAALALGGLAVDSAPDPAAAGLALLVGTLGMPGYTLWYSRLPRRVASALVVGQPLPEFELRQLEPGPFRSAALVGQPAVLMFFRGNWCPLCMAQIREIAAGYQDLQARGVRVALISGQSEKQTRSLARRFDVDFLHLWDPGFVTARALGLFHEGALPLGMGTAMQAESDAYLPTVVIVAADGIVADIIETDNYRVRPEPATFLAALDRIQGTG